MWLASLCPQLKELDRLDARVVAVLQGTPRQSYMLVQELVIPFTLLADEDGAAHQQFGAPAESGMAVYVADRQGVIRFTKRILMDDDVLTADEVIEQLRQINAEATT